MRRRWNWNERRLKCNQKRKEKPLSKGQRRNKREREAQWLSEQTSPPLQQLLVQYILYGILFLIMVKQVLFFILPLISYSLTGLSWQSQSFSPSWLSFRRMSRRALSAPVWRLLPILSACWTEVRAHFSQFFY